MSLFFAGLAVYVISVSFGVVLITAVVMFCGLALTRPVIVFSLLAAMVAAGCYWVAL